MYLLDDSGAIIDAECSFDQFGGAPCIVVESSGGVNTARGIKRRNPDYNRLLSVLFERLATAGAKIDRVLLDSNRVADLSVEARTVDLPIEYPVDLTQVEIAKFRHMLQREVALMHREPGVTKGGNAQKRIRILIDTIVDSERLVSKQGEIEAPDDIETRTPGLSDTERRYLRSARLGQGEFRKDLIQQFNGVCPVTGIGDERLLLASHIKPWKVCATLERLDASNGILFSALADRLFDKGLVTFTDSGDVIVAPSLSTADQIRCGIESWGKLPLSTHRKRYMQYHRSVEFKSA